MLKDFHTKGLLEAGCDEAGRGCLAGPVFAAAVILDVKHIPGGLNDSKKLSLSKRNKLRKLIEHQALSYAVAMASPAEIDEINILNASIKAMHKALVMLDKCPEQILVDGNKFRPFRDIPHLCVVKGDGIYHSIAAASVLAKTYRDEYMEKLHESCPDYGWNKNKGYPTRQHRLAIIMKGATEHHRRSFRLTDEQLSLDLS